MKQIGGEDINIKKRLLTSLPSCYAAGSVLIDEKRHLLLASEGQQECFAFSGDCFQEKKTVWTEPGGAMTFVPVPGGDGEFLAIQKFFRLYQWEGAELVWVKPGENDTFQVETVVNLPYIHRFDLFQTDRGCFFLGCTVAAHKDTLEDWAHPGSIYVGVLNKQTHKIDDLRVLHGGLYKNHGYFRVEAEDGGYGMVGCDQGIFEVHPPRGTEPWRIEHIFREPVSDMALSDIDNDGETELATIEPFHGEYFRIYKKKQGVYQRIFEHSEITEFYHVVWGGKLRGRNVFIGGCRRGKMQLFLVSASETDQSKPMLQLIDEGCGPSNVHVINRPDLDSDLIVAANRELGEAALYYVSD